MAFHMKNIGAPQQAARVIAGLVVAGAALYGLSGVFAWIGAAAGAGLALTGIAGYCPACAMAGIGGRMRS